MSGLMCKCPCGCLVALDIKDWIFCRGCGSANWGSAAQMAEHVTGYDGPRNRAGASMAKYSSTCGLCGAYVAKNWSWIEPDPTDPTRWAHAQCAADYRKKGSK
jgi:hypothetical protein